MKQKKQALAKSLLALLCCLAMLVGTTFAWFTDSVVSGYNTIAAGNLDVELYHSNATVTNQKVTESTMLFLDKNGDPILWEPGVVSYENLRVVNEGDLALIYQLAINTANENFILDNGARYGLSQVLKVGVVKGGITAADRDDVIASVTTWTTLSAFLREGSLEANAEEIWGIVIYWQPGDNDNNWNANNGKQLSSGTALSIDLGVKLTATQEMHEDDSFGTDYDATAKDDIFPSFEGGTAGVPVTPDANGYTTEAVTITAGDITAYVPAGVKLGAGVNSLTLSVNEMPFSEANVQLGSNEELLPLNVHVEGVDKDNTTPITITLPNLMTTGLNMGNYKVYHVENNATNEMTLVASDADFTAHNQYKYDPTTGDVVLYMATFSEVAVAATAPKWTGNVDHSWYVGKSSPYSIANADQLWSFSQIVGGMAEGIDRDNFDGKTVTLIANIDLNDMTDENSYTFYPIGYYNSTGSYNKVSGGSVTSSVASFEGTFDGNGHTIKNFFQNTWGMFGDYNDGYTGTPNHYKDAMGLFGYVLHGTVKNLTVENFKCDGEFAPTGVIAAFSEDSTFENIALVKCNPCVYNTGNGGIVGIGGDESDPENYKLTFNNITIDNTNKITALWGSWDVACGGLIGMFRGAGHVYMTNCHVGAQIDVYNDVCGNYQYYWYRYAGSLIGTNFNMTTDANGYTVPETDKYHATNCTVHFGDWNNYYYCELVANSLASYTHDHQMSRLTEIKSINGTQITYLDGSTGTVPSSGRYNYVVVNGAEGTENAKCYHFVDGRVWNHADAGEESVDVNGDGVKETVLKENNQHIYLPFNQLFTGYGWGVKHVPIYDDESLNPFPGVTVLERATANSVDKWNDKGINTIMNKTQYKLQDLFKAVSNDVGILDGSVTISLVNLSNGNPVSIAQFNRKTEWEKSTFELDGVGRVQITIQDYYFCQPTTIQLNVVNPPVSSIANNVIVNGDFESNIDGWNPGSWYNGTRKVTSAATKTGSKGLSITGAANNGGILEQLIPVEQGATYTLHFWYKVNAQGFNWKLQGSSNYTSGTETSTSWKLVTKDIVADSSTLTLKFMGYGNGKTEEFYLDNVVLEKKEQSVVNGHFELGKNHWDFNTGSAIMDIDDTHGGNYALRISDLVNQHGYGEAAVSKSISVDANKVYVIHWWSKRISGNGAFNLLTIGDVNKLAGQEWMNETSGNWVENFFVFRPEAGVNSIKLKLTSEVGNYADPGVILIDDLMLTEVDFDGYIVDGGFELGTRIGWTSYHSQVTEAAKRTGNYGLQFSTSANNWNGIGHIGFKTEVGKTYRVTFYHKISGSGSTAGANVQILAKDLKTKENITRTSGAEWPNATNTSNWTAWSCTFTATSTTTYLNLCGNGEPYSATVYFDDFKVEKIG